MNHKADSHAGQHNDENGPFEVWYSSAMSPVPEPGWYWWSCHPGCLPDGEPNGPFVTSHAAYLAAKELDFSSNHK